MATVTRDQKKLLKALKKEPHNPTVLVEVGWLHFENHEYPEAKQRFTEAVEAPAEPAVTADANYGLALLAQHAGRHEQARDLLRDIIKTCPTFPKRPEVHFALARANDLLWRNTAWPNAPAKAQADFLQRALDHYQQAIERQSQEHLQASFFLGLLYYETQQYADAFTYLRRASSESKLASPQAAEANALLGKICRDQQRDLAQAQAYFQLALKKGGKPAIMADLHRQLGDLSVQQGDDDQAVEQFDQALKFYQDVQSDDVLAVLVALGELRCRHHWFKPAVAYGERALLIPTQAETLQRRLWKVLAVSYAGIRAHDQAAQYEQQYFDACRENPEKAASLLRLGAVYEHRELLEKAADAYRKGLKFAAQNQVGSALNGALGRLYLHENRLNPAAKHLKEAIAFAGEQESAAALYLLLGECCVKRNELEQALEMYGTIIAKYPNSGEEPRAREELKRFRKQFEKEIQVKERSQKAAEDAKKMAKEFDTAELERLTALVDEILDEKGFFQRLKEGLAKTHLSLVGKIEALLASRKEVDDDLIEHLEELLILSDLGVDTTQRIITTLQESVKRKELANPAQVKGHLKREVQAILQHSEKTLDFRAKPYIILVIGVNGTGKTTTIGKMASKFKALGKDVLLVAGDTFRAAAIEQLEIWGERAGCEVVKHASGADPSAVMFDAIQAAKSRNVDVVLADTAGRLHTKKNLMEELKKMVRVMAREMPGAPHEILLVVDATTGQNAISQAKLFHEGVGLTGLILTKLDGTAKGGIIVSIANDLKIPMTYIGIGEKIEDLREFHAKEFVEALFED